MMRTTTTIAAALVVAVVAGLNGITCGAGAVMAAACDVREGLAPGAENELVRLNVDKATAGKLKITVHGRQTHGAAPWMGVDPIVTAFDANQIKDRHYLVMEYLDGETLEEVLKRRGKLRVRRQIEQLHSVTLVGASGAVSRTAPQWQLPV